MKEKTLDFLKKNYILIICVLCVAISLTAFIVAIASSEDNGESESEITETETKWGEGITEGIPEFSGDSVSLVSTGASVAAYYENVSGEQISEYAQTLESELSIAFSGESFPRSAKWGEKLITLHYNATEMRFSVTVSELGDNAQ